MQEKLSIDTSEFLARFANENAARVYLESMRWKGRPTCPFCGSAEHIDARMPFGSYLCAKCRGQFTVRTRSIFDRTNIPLRSWLFAMYVIEKTSFAISDLWLAETIGVSRATAHHMLQTLRKLEDDPPFSNNVVAPMKVELADELAA